MTYSLCINGKEPIADREHVRSVLYSKNICINSVFETLGYDVRMNNITKTLSVAKEEKRIVVKRKKTIIYDKEKINKIKLDTEYYNKAMYVDYEKLSSIIPCCCFSISRDVIYVITSHEEMYNSYIEFVKEKGEYKDGIYMVTAEANSWLSKGDISLCYIEESDTLRAIYNKHYGMVVTTTIDMSGIYSAYKWSYRAPHTDSYYYAEGEFIPEKDGSVRKDLKFLDLRIGEKDDRHFFVKLISDEIYFLKDDLDSLFRGYNSPLSSKYLMS